MAQAQLIQGNAEILLTYLQQHRQQQNLLLIVPEQSEDKTAFVVQPETALEKAQIRNGVPLFPTSDARRPVTMELVKQLMDEG